MEEIIFVLFTFCMICVRIIFDLPGGYFEAFGEGQCYILHLTISFISLSQLTLAYIMLCRH